MEGNYFFIDGSALNAQIRYLWREIPALKNRKLCPKLFLSYFMNALTELHQHNYKRATFYFPSGDEDGTGQHIIIPNYRVAGELRDMHIKYCGHKLKKSVAFDKFVQEKVPEEFKNRFSKSEKGIDIEICCDAFKLASHGKLDRLFLFTNDDDFLPFCKTIKEYGSNISIIHLTDKVTSNLSLLKETDTYDVVPEHFLDSMFLPIPEQNAAPLLPIETTAVGDDLKPDAAPSDMKVEDESAIPSSEPVVEAKKAPKLKTQ